MLDADKKYIMPNALLKALSLTILPFLLTGCLFNSLLKNSYTHLVLEKYSKSRTQPAYIQTTYDPYAIHNALFSDFLIIGKSSFTAQQVNVRDYVDYGKSIGADLVIASFQNKQVVTKYITIDPPNKGGATITEDTVLETGKDGKKHESKKVIIQKENDQSISIPYTVTYFDQKALFLKRIGNAKAPWEYTKSDFTLDNKDSADQYLGEWIISKTCNMRIYSTKNEYLGFIHGPKCKEKSKINKMLTWEGDDIKLRINKQSKQGFYLTQGKIPVLVKAQINKSNNYLELMDQNTNQVIIYFQRS